MTPPIQPTSSPSLQQSVVVGGGGFAGLRLIQHLRDAPVNIVLIDRCNHHLFQPLLYQVATAALAPDEIAEPTRSILRGALAQALDQGQASEPAPQNYYAWSHLRSRSIRRALHRQCFYASIQ